MRAGSRGSSPVGRPSVGVGVVVAFVPVLCTTITILLPILSGPKKGRRRPFRRIIQIFIHMELVQDFGFSLSKKRRRRK